VKQNNQSIFFSPVIVVSRTIELFHRNAFGCAAVALLGSLLVLTGAGCSSSGTPTSASFASVTLRGYSLQQIGTTTKQVFQEAGYSGGSFYRMEQMVFERQGSSMNNLAYGGLSSAQSGTGVTERVKTELVSLGVDSYRLQCQAYMVRNAGDSFYADEQRLSSFRSGPYQKLLDEVAKRLASTSANR
jgi:hypothetical protein